MTKMTQYTEKSWFLQMPSGDHGFLFKNENGYLFLSLKTRIEFKSLDDVEKKFGKLTKEKKQKIEEINEIHGFPVKHDQVEMKQENPPLYTTGGRILFAAGYWGLKYPNGWTMAFCPKKKTIDEYEHLGPFKTKLELSAAIGSKTTQEALESDK